jgi:hypothetical protein
MKSEKFSFKTESLVEIRSTGQQTIVPPSRHPDGDQLRSESKGRAAKVSKEDLRQAVRRLAAATLLVRNYPSKGSRNDFVLALAGMLQRANWEEIEIGEFIGTIARAAHDEEWASRKAAARSTRKRMENGGSATGRPRLSKLIRRNVVDQVCEWLGISDFSPLVTKPDSRAVDWPKPLSEAAYRGPVGEIVNTIEPETEADPAAILVQLLVAFGNSVGIGLYFFADGARQRTNIFCLVVGQTSKARKGTALKHVLSVMERVDPQWGADRIINGLSSGEGLITAVQDPVGKLKDKNGKRLKDEDKDLKDKRVRDKEALYQHPFAHLRICTPRELSSSSNSATPGETLRSPGTITAHSRFSRNSFDRISQRPQMEDFASPI